MKRAGPGRISLVICFLVWVLFLLAGTFGVWALITDWNGAPQSVSVSGTGDWKYVLAIPLFWSFILYYAYRFFYLGAVYLLYDEEKVIFVLSRRDRRTYRWSELLQSGVRLRSLSEVEPATGIGFFFEFPDKKRIVLRPVVSGYRELFALLVRKHLVRPAETSKRDTSFWVDN